jgi:hypothetical protein
MPITSRIRQIATATALALAFPTAPKAQADGVMFPLANPVQEHVGQAQQFIPSPRQEAILITDGHYISGDQDITVVLRTHFRTGPAELAWIVPVPAKPTVLGQADDRLFTELEAQTAPRFYVEHRYEPEGGAFHVIGCSATGPVMQEPTRDLVTRVRVESTGIAGIYDYAVLSAARVSDVTDWLKSHGYAAPRDTATVLQPYVSGHWFFLAMKIRSDPEVQATTAPHPIVYSYHATSLVYPMAISKVSSDSHCEVLLYVLAPQRYTCNNWDNLVTIGAWDQLKRATDTPSGTTYEKWFEQRTREAQGRLFITEFAGSEEALSRLVQRDQWLAQHPRDKHYWRDEPEFVGSDLALSELVQGTAHVSIPDSAHYLTRLRAVMEPTTIDRDVELWPAPGRGGVSRDIRITAQRDRAPTVTAAAGGMGVLLLLVVPRRYRSKIAAALGAALLLL